MIFCFKIAFSWSLLGLYLILSVNSSSSSLISIFEKKNQVAWSTDKNSFFSQLNQLELYEIIFFFFFWFSLTEKDNLLKHFREFEQLGIFQLWSSSEFNHVLKVKYIFSRKFQFYVIVLYYLIILNIAVCIL